MRTRSGVGTLMPPRRLGRLGCVLTVAGALRGLRIGARLGPKIFRGENVRFLNRKHLDRAHEFYERYGGKTIILARFMPIVRTFAPFVAGIGSMSYARFTLFNLIGALAWVVSLCLAGYWLGNLPWVRANLSLIIVGIIAFTLVPVGIGYVKSRTA